MLAKMIKLKKFTKLKPKQNINTQLENFKENKNQINI